MKGEDFCFFVFNINEEKSLGEYSIASYRIGRQGKWNQSPLFIECLIYSRHWPSSWGPKGSTGRHSFALVKLTVLEGKRNINWIFTGTKWEYKVTSNRNVGCSHMLPRGEVWEGFQEDMAAELWAEGSGLTWGEETAFQAQGARSRPREQGPGPESSLCQDWATTETSDKGLKGPHGWGYKNKRNKISLERGAGQGHSDLGTRFKFAFWRNLLQYGEWIGMLKSLERNC